MIPPLLEFRIEAFRFEDIRRSSREESLEAQRSFKNVLLPVVGEARDLLKLCDTTELLPLPAVQPGQTTDEYLATVALRDHDHRPESTDSECDPRLQFITLAVFRGPPERMVGAFTIYNIVVESEDATNIVVSAGPAPAIEAQNQAERAQTWGRIVRGILEEDIPLEDGRTLNIDEWRFPTVEGKHQWKSHTGDDPEADAIIAELEGHGHNVTRKTEQGRVTPEKCRRVRI